MRDMKASEKSGECREQECLEGGWVVGNDLMLTHNQEHLPVRPADRGSWVT